MEQTTTPDRTMSPWLSGFYTGIGLSSAFVAEAYGGNGIGPLLLGTFAAASGISDMKAGLNTTKDYCTSLASCALGAAPATLVYLNVL